MQAPPAFQDVDQEKAAAKLGEMLHFSRGYTRICGAGTLT
jgi:hypothetical protein